METIEQLSRRLVTMDSLIARLRHKHAKEKLADAIERKKDLQDRIRCLLSAQKNS